MVDFDLRKYSSSGPEDPLYKSMWYLNPDFEPRKRTTSMANAGKTGTMRHMNVVGAWKRGYSGKGVVVTILDDGIEKDHPDLEQNYDPDASFDINDNDIDPQPRYNPSNENRYVIIWLFKIFGFIRYRIYLELNYLCQPCPNNCR